MRLTLEDGTSIDNPDAEEIETALRSLTWLTDNAFAILGEMGTYIQTAQDDIPENAEPHYVLEYQAGSLEEHYEATDAPLDLERIIDAFQRYARGENSWKDLFTWRKMIVEQ